MHKLLTIALLCHAAEGQEIFEAVKDSDTIRIGHFLESDDFDINARGPGG